MSDTLSSTYTPSEALCVLLVKIKEFTICGRKGILKIENFFISSESYEWLDSRLQEQNVFPKPNLTSNTKKKGFVRNWKL